MRTHLSDKGQLQGDIEDDLGVAGCQLLSSVWGKAAPSQSSRVGQPLCDICFQHVMCWGKMSGILPGLAWEGAQLGENGRKPQAA